VAPTLLVRPPSPRLAEGLVTHVTRRTIDVDRALRQWKDYVTTLADLGWNVVTVPPADECPDSVFVEDTVVMFRGTAIVTSPGAPQRRPEIDGVDEIVRNLGLPTRRIEPHHRLDGGDVLKIGDTVYVGRSGRTDDAGIASLSRIVEDLGGRVVTVPVTKVLHLKSALTALPDGTVIGWDPVVDDPTAFARYRSAPEESGAHVVVHDDRTVVLATSAPITAEALRRDGWRVITVDISEFEKLEGCVTCLSVRVRELPRHAPR
jgi:dimethylargininase